LEKLPGGLYEKVIDRADAERLGPLGDRIECRALTSVEASRRLARALHDYLVRALEDLPEKEGPKAQVDICNRLVSVLIETRPDFANECDALTNELLTAVREETQSFEVRPSIPLSESALFVNASRERRIDSELPREIGSADAVDLLCPFLFWQGYRLVKDALVRLCERGGRLRVLTSTYCKMTERQVLEDLVRMGAEVRVSYEEQSTRLHAKAWFFRRKSGYSTAFVGSSNLSKTALTSGLEWNIRLSQIENRATLEEFEHAFENYWNDPGFRPFDVAEFIQQIRVERQGDTLEHVFELRPYYFQQEILDRLAFERSENDRHRNLVVAATGTGKTVVAALDYKQIGAEKGARPSLLFVAHRKEILRQARDTFRHAVGSGSFGELYVDGEVPQDWRHVFASVQALRHVKLDAWAKDRFDVFIVDEFHHASEENRTYARLLEYLKPRELLGLTATPERTDGVDVKGQFDGRITAEIRLWDAIDRGLLVPFQYFAVHDSTDLSQIAWKRGRYDTQALEGYYTTRDARAHLVCKAVKDVVDDVQAMRAIGFCVGVGHARHMAAAFQHANLPAVAVTGDTPRQKRASAISALKSGELRAIFAVDVFNEGVDIPEVDTLLFLRPTESATLFTQQLGRGLRRSDNKRCLTVLDFVGQAHQKFRYDLRFRALTGTGRATLKKQIEDDFPYLPAGCSIRFDRESRDAVLENLRQGIATNKRSLLAELRSLGDVSLTTFLTECNLRPEDLYRGRRTFTELRRAVSLATPAPGPKESEILHRIGSLTHIDDPLRLEIWPRLLEGREPRNELEARLRLMLVTPLVGTSAAADPKAALEEIRLHPALIEELQALLAYQKGSREHATIPFRHRKDVPLLVHARYTRDEIMAAFSIIWNGKVAAPQKGVVWDEPSRCKVLLVTITKDERDYSPTTLYKDYAISRDRFHWQSQNDTRQDSDAGRRILHHEQQVVTPLLFIRPTKKDDRGHTTPYTFAGRVTLIVAEGERPINIEWQLEHAMPPDLFKIAAVLAS